MDTARSGSVVTWIYAAAFGVPAIPVAIYLRQRGTLPVFMGLFPMYGGPWSGRFDDGTFVWLLLAFLGLTAVAAWSGWLLWRRRRSGAVLNVALLPLEAVFWIGFALPLPWIIGAVRAILVASGWRSLDRTGSRI